MPRTATVYLHGPGEVPAGIRHLLNSHGIAFITVDAGGDPGVRATILRKANAPDLPVVQLDASYAAGTDVSHLARVLGLTPPRRPPMPIGACC